MRHKCLVIGVLVVLFALLGTLALFSRKDSRPGQIPAHSIQDPLRAPS
ncbi:hypothetical protein SAMN05443582_103314 [Phyllobacterium sp. OV277]|nr:hypothetical protein SAMN05443582_103314 [Phyllobacterium sp. OV277]